MGDQVALLAEAGLGSRVQAAPRFHACQLAKRVRPASRSNPILQPANCRNPVGALPEDPRAPTTVGG